MVTVMGLSSLNPLRWREVRRSQQLPVYKELPSPTVHSPTKERYSDDEYSSDEDENSDDEATDYSSSPPNSRGSSRQTSTSMSSASAAILGQPKKAKNAPRRPAVRRYLYRLPNRVIRYLCIGMISTIIIFIFGLVRASQIENKRIAEGKVDRKPVVAPPWESFEFLTRYYGGIRTLVPFDRNIPQYPRLQDEGPYNATGKSQARASKRASGEEAPPFEPRELPPSKVFAEYPGANALRSTKTQIHECFLDEQRTVRIPPIRYFDGRPDGFPDNILGSYELLSLPEDICFDRYGRYGPYGYGYSVRTGGLGVGEHGEDGGSEAVWDSVKKVDWRNNVNWAEAQRRCYNANIERFKPAAQRDTPPTGFYIHDPTPKKLETIDARGEDAPQVVKSVRSGKSDATTSGQQSSKANKTASKTAGDLPRTAVVLRCWDEFFWAEEDVMNLRALIAELSLASGGRYDVHLLVQVKNDAAHPVWADDEAYRSRIKEAIPEEFQGMATLWTETQMLALYQGIHDLFARGPDLPVHGSYRGLQMAMQHFAYNHPEYEYFWQWEMDIRYTGHYYDLFTKLENWSREQPRKGLWERNARFYVPYVHGSWEDFKQMSRVQTEHGTPGPDNIWEKIPGAKKDPVQAQKGEESIWGPKRPLSESDWFEIDNDPQPPTTYERDKYVWGVGEEADLITFSPIFNPEGTTWGLADDITGYNNTAPDGGKPPRRAQIITASRMSRKLLMQMHRETAFKKHHAFPEMWPATVALQHGYKAVYAPHPVFVDREWPTDYMARVLNGGKNGASGGARTSVFGDREHNMLGLTWFYNAGFSGNLYRRWVGLKVNNDGGEQFELYRDETMDDMSVPTMKGGEGRMCLPPMLLHPIKAVEIPVEEQQKFAVGEGGIEGETVESDPSA
ncbi:hypothetical protein QBC46DRAFT_306930 [Diplogelasinospora grovesii]|uniref:Major facilitator superfamily transporter n=1 Tax=Diplogelasinospora grovesii TaxID=303347 RepID=A0AAN6NDE4_9PEZI|nr:hypothetical protein QBC46DRAFT_306930 [Diplogelasinospora grovesii]